MKALVIRGKDIGKEVEISQWCNDWFSIMNSNKIFSPTSLAFTFQDFQFIKNHNNNGVLFKEFEPRELKGKFGAFEMTFAKRKVEKRRFLTHEEALALINRKPRQDCHVFHNPAGMLIGFDISMARIKQALKKAKTIELGGKECMGMGHGIVIIPADAKYQRDIWFVQHDEELIKKYL